MYKSNYMTSQSKEKEKSNFEKIIEFHTSFGIPYNQTLNTTEIQTFRTASLRIKLINEELNELYSAKDLIQQLDAIGDLLYVVYGTGATFGINLDAEFNIEYMTQLQSAKELSIYDTGYPNHPKRTFVENIQVGTNFRKILYLYPLLRAELRHPYCVQPTYIITNKEIDFAQQLLTLSHSILICDFTGIRNVLVKMLFILYGVGYFCKFDIDKLYAEIHRSNMSKLCNSEQEAIDTVKWYQQYQSSRYPNPAYRKANDDIHFIVFDQSTDKRLKSINYSPPVIDPTSLTLK